MLAIWWGAIGLAVFVGGALVLGLSLRRHPSSQRAERSSRLMHFLFFAGLGAPFLVALVSPGITRLDALLGVASLPARPLFLALGAMLGLPGLRLLAASNRSLRALGSGANEFRLTQRIVAADVYRHTRNPMSLGYYLSCLALAFLSGSTVLTTYVTLGIIPAHLFFLRFFEERELELRFGEGYTRYRREVPFLIPRRAA